MRKTTKKAPSTAVHTRKNFMGVNCKKYWFKEINLKLFNGNKTKYQWQSYKKEGRLPVTGKAVSVAETQENDMHQDCRWV